MTSPAQMAVILSCEHATNKVPDQYRPLLADCLDQLSTHQGYDPGALDFAKLLAERLSAPLFAGSISRLLVDLNRSLRNRRTPPVKKKCDLTSRQEELLIKYYLTYRRQIDEAIGGYLRQGQTVVHLSIHSFTPILAGVCRTADVGFLYDPGRLQEKEFCDKWRSALAARDNSWRLRRNYPYRGISDGLVRTLRQKYPAHHYLGIELEINQIYPLERTADWLRLQQQLLASLVAVL